MRGLLFVGSVTRPVPYLKDAHGPGIAAFRVDLESGAATPLGTLEDIENPAFVAVSPDGVLLAAASEISGESPSLVSTYAIAQAIGRLQFRGRQTSGGATAAHVSFDLTGRHVGVANYHDVPAAVPAGAPFAILPLDATGAPDAPWTGPTYSGHGPNKARQNRPHAHCLRWSPDNGLMAVVDLGIDRVLLYRLDGKSSVPAGEAALPPGSGPRHLVFHPTLPFAYVINELTSTLASFAFAGGALKLLALEPARAAGAYRDNTGSFLVLSGDGTHAFSGNRGDDSIARFDIGRDGIARFIKATPSGGRMPRDAVFDPTGRVLAVANALSDAVRLFRYEAGNLTHLGDIATGSPTSVAFHPQTS